MSTCATHAASVDPRHPVVEVRRVERSGHRSARQFVSGVGVGLYTLPLGRSLSDEPRTRGPFARAYYLSSFLRSASLASAHGVRGWQDECCEAIICTLMRPNDSEDVTCVRVRARPTEANDPEDVTRDGASTCACETERRRRSHTTAATHAVDPTGVCRESREVAALGCMPSAALAQ